MTTVRYARVKSTITDENSDENVNQLQTIDSEDEDEEDVLPGTPVKTTSRDSDPNVTIKQAAERRSLIKTVLLTGLLISCYFVLSIGLTFYQRWLLKVIRWHNKAEKHYWKLLIAVGNNKLDFASKLLFRIIKLKVLSRNFQIYFIFLPQN